MMSPTVSLTQPRTFLPVTRRPQTTAASGRLPMAWLACTVPKLDARPGPGVSLANLGCSLVLVDHSAEDWVASDGRVEWGHRGRVVEWWVLVEALVRAILWE